MSRADDIASRLKRGAYKRRIWTPEAELGHKAWQERTDNGANTPPSAPLRAAGVATPHDFTWLTVKRCHRCAASYFGAGPCPNPFGEHS